jgi:hypothetical protein
LWIRQGAYSRFEDLKGASLWLAPALSTIIRLGWKDLPTTNTLVYYNYKNSLISEIKSFITLGPGIAVDIELLNYVQIKHLSIQITFRTFRANV